MNVNKKIKNWLVPLLMSSAGLAVGAEDGSAQPVSESPLDATQAHGSIVKMTTAPRGEIDGAVLEDGTWLHWPPHLQNQFKSALKQGDRVVATGRTETGPRGDTHFEVRRVTILEKNTTIENPDFDKAPPPPHRHRKGRHGPHGEPRAVQFRTVSGTAERFTKAPRGEVDGVVLDTGTWLHWPPHLENQFAPDIRVGDSLEATGFEKITPKGDAHFEVGLLSNRRTGKNVENEDVMNQRPVEQVGASSESSDAEARLERQLREMKEKIDRLQRIIDELHSRK